MYKSVMPGSKNDMGLEKSKKSSLEPMFDLGPPSGSLSDRKAAKKKAQNLSKSTMNNDMGGLIKRKTDMMMVKD